MRTLLSATCLLAILVTMPAAAQRVSPTAPVPNRTIGPGSQRPPGDHPQSNAGSIEGFVYWDAKHFSHVPAGTCSGLAVTVAVGSSSGGPLVAYTPLATLTNNFKYVGQVKEFLAGGKVNVYDVCTYGYDHVPVGPDLQVKLTVIQSGAFSPVAIPQSAILGPIKIINAQCNMLPRITNPTVSDLFAHWGSCQNMAYNVNFVMHTAPRGSLGDSGSGGITPATSGSQREMLSGAPQRGILANGAGSTMQSSSRSGGLLENRGQTTPAMPAGRPPAGTGTTRNASARTLTNSDVTAMLKARLGESVIISSIRSARKNFDFSPAGCEALRRARVSAAILAEMGDSSVRPCPELTGTSPAATPGSKVELNPQPLPPRTGISGGTTGSGAKVPPNAQQLLASRKRTSPGSGAALKPVKLAPPKALRKITNPRLAQQNASIFAVLQQQKQAAEQESAAMKFSSRSGVSARVPSPALAANVQRNPWGKGLGPETTQSASGGIASRIGHASAFDSTVLACSQDPNPRILHVTGGQASAIFTPEAKYNLYTIVGCSFGQSQTGNSTYIFGVNGFKASLNIDFWSDNGITVHLDPWLAGVLDQENVTLVVAPAGKQPIQKQGFKFYAARGMPGPDGSPQEVQLAYDSMPQPAIGLLDVANFLAGVDQLPSNAQSQFPSFSFQGTPVAGWVFRYAYGHKDGFVTDCYINDAHYDDGQNRNGPCANYINYAQTGGGSDTWNFAKLAPGFAISSYELYFENTDPSTLCGAWDDAHSKYAGQAGHWDFTLTSQSQISVTWPAYYCQDGEWTLRTNFQYQSSYGVGVWVMGPRCVDPWTGRPDQSCMTKLRHILGG